MRFLLATWGSTGDLHPLLALGQEMLQRGHTVTLAGNPVWETDVEEAGLRFLAFGPAQSTDNIFAHSDVLTSKKLGYSSLRSLIEVGIAPTLEDSYQVLYKAAQSHDVLVAHFLVLAAGTVAEKTGINWATISTTPGVVPSCYTMPASCPLKPFPGAIGQLGNHLVWRLCGRLTRRIVDPPLNRLRKKVNLPPLSEVFYTGTSPRLSLQLYSPHFAQRPTDWTAEKKLTGFCYWNPSETFEPSLTLQKFLAAGPKPWLFTLGTAVVAQPGNFYSTVLEAMRGIQERAIILTGLPQNTLGDLPPNVMELNYAPYDWIMPRCSAVAHQCGMGTISHVLRAGLPSVACPYAFDQPDNARRLQGLGAAKYLPSSKRTAADLRAAMREVAMGPIASRARILSKYLHEENGPQRACELLEKTFAKAVTEPVLMN